MTKRPLDIDSPDETKQLTARIRNNAPVGLQLLPIEFQRYVEDKAILIAQPSTAPQLELLSRLEDLFEALRETPELTLQTESILRKELRTTLNTFVSLNNSAKAIQAETRKVVEATTGITKIPEREKRLPLAPTATDRARGIGLSIIESIEQNGHPLANQQTVKRLANERPSEILRINETIANAANIDPAQLNQFLQDFIQLSGRLMPGATAAYTKQALQKFLTVPIDTYHKLVLFLLSITSQLMALSTMIEEFYKPQIAILLREAKPREYLKKLEHSLQESKYTDTPRPQLEFLRREIKVAELALEALERFSS